MNDTLGKLVVDGIEFSVSRAVISKSRDVGWDLEVCCNERRVSRFGDEICAAYLQITGLRFVERSGGGKIFPEAVSLDEWNRTEMDRVNETYFTLLGEGFPIWSAQVQIREQQDETWLIMLNGVTDYPLRSYLEEYEISLKAAVEVLRP